jgi:hypothetical protein
MNALVAIVTGCRQCGPKKADGSCRLGRDCLRDCDCDAAPVRVEPTTDAERDELERRKDLDQQRLDAIDRQRFRGRF